MPYSITHDYKNMGHPPQELERRQRCLFAEVTVGASRQEMTTLEPAAHELLESKPSAFSDIEQVR